jgi:FdhD protein
MIIKVPAIQVNKDKIIQIENDVCVEESYQLFLNDESLVNLVASPSQLRELGLGFVMSNGLVKNKEDIESVDVVGKKIKVYAKARTKAGVKLIQSGGGISVGKTLKKVHSSIHISQDDVFKIISEIESDIWKKTGGVHCSVIFSEGQLIVKAIDVGRHNTVDKVIGHAVLHNIDLSQCILGCSGRQPAGMVAKAANVGIPIIVSKSCSTDKGIALSAEAGITLIGFARDSRFTVYTCPHRIEQIL